MGGADEEGDGDLEDGDEDLAIPPYMQYEIEQEEKRRVQQEAELKAKMEMGGGERQKNPLLQQEGLPKFETITPEAAKPVRRAEYDSNRQAVFRSCSFFFSSKQARTSLAKLCVMKPSSLLLRAIFPAFIKPLCSEAIRACSWRRVRGPQSFYLV